ncbi:uncharacterized protein LOC113403442 [Vanessa tameamea]|uniref:Uncharacterized protein LOC113403442 n=1 Tax=Vanessa tameamea TaxID=334116 RepID=A0A8B8ITB5_VANTA
MEFTVKSPDQSQWGMDRKNKDEGYGAKDGEILHRIKINEYLSNLPKMFESIEEEVMAAVIPPNADEETKKRLYANLQICKDNVMSKILKAMEMSQVTGDECTAGAPNQAAGSVSTINT